MGVGVGGGGVGEEEGQTAKGVEGGTLGWGLGHGVPASALLLLRDRFLLCLMIDSTKSLIPSTGSPGSWGQPR